MHRGELSKSRVRGVKSHLGLQVPLGTKHCFGALFLSSASWKVGGAEALSSFRSCCERQPWSFPSGRVPAPVPFAQCPSACAAVQALWPWVIYPTELLTCFRLLGGLGGEAKESVCMDHGHRADVWVWGLLQRIAAEDKVLRYSLFPFALEALVNSWVSRGSKVGRAKREGLHMGRKVYIWETGVASAADSPAELAARQLALAEEKDWFASCVGFSWFCMLWIDHLGHATRVSVYEKLTPCVTAPRHMRASGTRYHQASQG